MYAEEQAYVSLHNSWSWFLCIERQLWGN